MAILFARKRTVVEAKWVNCKKNIIKNKTYKTVKSWEQQYEETDTTQTHHTTHSTLHYTLQTYVKTYVLSVLLFVACIVVDHACVMSVQTNEQEQAQVCPHQLSLQWWANIKKRILMVKSNTNNTHEWWHNNDIIITIRMIGQHISYKNSIDIVCFVLSLVKKPFPPYP